MSAHQTNVEVAKHTNVSIKHLNGVLVIKGTANQIGNQRLWVAVIMSCDAFSTIVFIAVIKLYNSLDTHVKNLIVARVCGDIRHIPGRVVGYYVSILDGSELS